MSLYVFDVILATNIQIFYYYFRKHNFIENYESAQFRINKSYIKSGGSSNQTNHDLSKAYKLVNNNIVTPEHMSQRWIL